MKRTIVMLALMLSVGFATGILAERVFSAQAGPKRTVILTTDLEGLPGLEANMIIADLAPGVWSGKHYHPGYDLVYVLEGHGELAREGQPALELKPGVSFYNYRSTVHEVRNLSQTEPMKVLAVYITDKGKPSTVQVK